jgi:hypothetical protein
MFARFLRHLENYVEWTVRFTPLFSIAVVAALLLAGCTTATSLNAPTYAPPNGEKKVSGLYYYLPQAFLEVSGRIEPADKDAKDNLPAVRKGDFTMTVGVDLEADRGARFFFRPSEDIMSDIDTRQVVNQKGLLDTVSSTTAPRVVPAALAIAQMVPTVLDLGPAGSNAAHAPFYYRFDPFDGARVAAVQRELLDQEGVRLTIAPSLERGKNPSTAYPPADKYPGVMFRPVVPLSISLRVAGGSPLQDRTASVTVPDKRALMVFDLTRAVFVDKAMELQFRDGVLVSAVIEKPGIVTSIITIPLTLIKTVFFPFP